MNDDGPPMAQLPQGRVPRGRRVPLDTGRVAFARIAGNATDQPPVLLLHGLGATAALNWVGSFEPLIGRTKVLALDHHGHGRGPRVGNRFSLAACADDAAALLRAAEAGPAIVAGYSMGGPIAQLLALRHPELVRGLIFCATARDFRGRPSERLRFGALAAAAGAATVGPRTLTPPLVPLLPGRLRGVSWSLAEMRRHEPAAVVAAGAALGRYTSRDWIGTLDVPSAVVVHQRDRLVPTHRQRKLAAALPDAEVFEVDTDHMGVAREPHVFVPALLRAHDSVVERLAVTDRSSDRQPSDRAPQVEVA
jgi:3-oxoadipate enol-lactonase